jgi:hypothetical protein
MKAQLHNLRTALWWFQRQSEAKQSGAGGLGRAAAPRLPAFMNRIAGAAASATAEEHAVLVEFYREQGLPPTSGGVPLQVSRFSVYADSHRMLKAGRGREDAFVEMRTAGGGGGGGGGEETIRPAQLLEVLAHEHAGLTHAFVKLEWHQYTGKVEGGYREIRSLRQAALLPVMQVHAALVAVTDWDGQHPADSGCYWVVSTDRPLPQCQGGPVGRLQEMGMPHAARG